LILLIYSSLMYGLQRLCYGPLRPIEIEQLYEKGWFAVTETCLAMTIFREEVGPWFLVMFVALITGKVWGWIGDGRVEILEQQPPANPRLFHFRLSVSLGISVLYDIWMMSYTISTVIQQARPNMMVMFLFEFTILTTSSVSTAVRYLISLHEARVIKKQTRERLAERRRELREERAEMIRQREEAAAAAASGDGTEASPSTEPLPSEDDVEEMDIEVPGWETKGQWILTLDLITGEQCGVPGANLANQYRFCETEHLPHILLYPSPVLRHSNSYNARSFHDNKIIREATHRIPSVPSSNARYEQEVWRCHGGGY
jgi:E3 ubiquitin-protein ligase synoviolin